MPFLRNWKNLVVLAYSGYMVYGNSNSESVRAGNLVIKDTSGNRTYVNRSSYRSQGQNLCLLGTDNATSSSSGNTEGSKRGQVYIGSGSTAVSDSDYHMESLISSGILVSQDYDNFGVTLCQGFASYRAMNDTTSEFTISIIGINTTENDIVIREVGFGNRVYGNDTTSTSTITSHNVLLFREILDTPVTVTPGSNYRIDINVSFT